MTTIKDMSIRCNIPIEKSVNEISESFMKILVDQLQLFVNICIEHGSISPDVMEQVVNEYVLITKVNGLKAKRSRAPSNIIASSMKSKKSASVTISKSATVASSIVEAEKEESESIVEKAERLKKDLDLEKLEFVEIPFKDSNILIIEAFQFDDGFFPEVDSNFFVISAVDPLSDPQTKRKLTEDDIDFLDILGLDYR